jgi:hypothetical protein
MQADVENLPRNDPIFHLSESIHAHPVVRTLYVSMQLVRDTDVVVSRGKGERSSGVETPIRGSTDENDWLGESVRQASRGSMCCGQALGSYAVRLVLD